MHLCEYNETINKTYLQLVKLICMNLHECTTDANLRVQVVVYKSYSQHNKVIGRKLNETQTKQSSMYI